MSSEQREIFNNTLYVVDEALRSLREISNNLAPRPHRLRPGPRHTDLRRQGGRAAKVKDIVRHEPARRALRPRHRGHNDRVVCELITNSLKHSGCSEIRLLARLRATRSRCSTPTTAADSTRRQRWIAAWAFEHKLTRVSSLNGLIRHTLVEGSRNVRLGQGKRTRRRAPCRQPAAIETPRPVRAKNATDDTHSPRRRPLRSLRHGLKMLLEMCLRGSWPMPPAARSSLEQIASTRPDVVFMDYAMPA